MAAPLSEDDRRRLLELRGLHPTLPVLVFHPLLTVVTGFGREASDSVVESLGRLGAPLGPAVSGTVDIGGQIGELPGALADPDTRPEVVRGPMIVGEIGRKRAADAAIDVNKRAARVSRREAGLARRDQLVDRLEQLSTRADEIERELNEAQAVDDGEIQRLLVAARLPDPTTSNPIITALIDEWDALVVERKANSGGPTVERAEANLETVRARIAQRESADEPAGSDNALDASGVARAQEAHATVERLASGLDEARRSERKAAGQKLANAVEAERQALADVGFESYASFLLAMAEGRGQDDRSHDEAALVTAESALARARDREQVFVLLSERELDLRARVARLLGRLPGPDVGAELRGGRESASPSAGARERLESTLRALEVPTGDDPVAAAERYLDGGASRRAHSSALRAELEEIESEGSRLDEQLDLAEHELAAAERDLIASVSGTLAGREAPVALSSAEPGELKEALGALVAPTGPPVVLGECFLDLGPEGRTAILDTLSETASRRQVVIVTELDAVAEWALGRSGDAAVWTPLEAELAQREADGVDADAAFDEVAAEVEPEITVEPEIEVEVEAEAEVEVEVEVARVALEAPVFESPVVEPMVGAATAEAVATPEAPAIEDFPVAAEATAPAPAAAAEPPRPAGHKGVWPPPPSALRFGWETADDDSADGPDEPEPVQDFFAPRPEPVVEPSPPAPAAPPVAPRSVPDRSSGAPERPRRVPALFDREAQEALEQAEATAAAAAVEALPVHADPVRPAPSEPVRHNPLDDLFAGASSAEPKPSSRKSKSKLRAERPKPEPKAKAEPKPKPEKVKPEKAKAEPQPSRAAGPWKPPASGRRRKNKAAPTPPPWEGRFDTSRERPMPGVQVTPLPPGSAPLAVCVRHTGAVTRRRCARCNEPACDECLVTPRGRRSAMCIECAIIEAGVRSRRRLRG